MENKYQNGKIYQITDNAYTKFYIGSTTVSLSKRMTKHREMYKRFLDGKCRKQMNSTDLFEEFGMKNCKIELLETFPCASKEELLKREGYFIRKIPCVNRTILGRSKKEYCMDTKEKKAEYDKAYRAKNKDRLQEQKKIKYGKCASYTCPCGSVYNYTNRRHHEKSKKHLTWLETQEPEPEN